MVKALITQRELVNQYGGLSDSLENEYVDYFSKLGITVFPVSNFGSIDEVLSLDWDLIILTGGGILPQKYYNYERKGAQQDHRDAVEEKLVKMGIEKNIPILGICRGMQMLNSIFGGRVSSTENCAVERIISKSHPVIIKGQEYIVNNYHNDGVMVLDLADGFEVLAIDPDNKTVEAFYDGVNSILGIQWHPERPGNDKAIQMWVEEKICNLLR